MVLPQATMAPVSAYVAVSPKNQTGARATGPGQPMLIVGKNNQDPQRQANSSVQNQPLSKEG